MANLKPVAIIMGSDSDWPALKDASKILKEFGVAHHIEVVSAHRTAKKMLKFAESADKKFKVIIAGAGGAAHLPGMVASLCSIPVIGVPIKVGSLNGLDALLSIVQMPRGVPVACVGVDNSTNSALLALQILALENHKLKQDLLRFRKKQKIKVTRANHKLRKTGRKSSRTS